MLNDFIYVSNVDNLQLNRGYLFHKTFAKLKDILTFGLISHNNLGRTDAMSYEPLPLEYRIWFMTEMETSFANFTVPDEGKVFRVKASIVHKLAKLKRDDQYFTEKPNVVMAVSEEFFTIEPQYLEILIEDVWVSLSNDKFMDAEFTDAELINPHVKESLKILDYDLTDDDDLRKYCIINSIGNLEEIYRILEEEDLFYDREIISQYWEQYRN